MIMTYTVQYFNEREGAWKATGAGTIYDKDMARKRMRAMSEQCDYCVRFRIEPQVPSGTVEFV